MTSGYALRGWSGYDPTGGKGMVWAWSLHIMSCMLSCLVSNLLGYKTSCATSYAIMSCMLSCLVSYHVFHPTSKPKSFRAMSLRAISIFRIYEGQGNRVQQAPGPPPVCPGYVVWCGREAVWRAWRCMEVVHESCLTASSALCRCT